MSEDLEKVYRELVLSELREMSQNQKEMLDRIKTIEVVVIGVDNKSGLMSRVGAVEKEVEELKKLKIQLITAFTVVQAIAGVLLTVALKLGWFH